MIKRTTTEETKMNISRQVVILSAETGNATFEGNRQRTENLESCLADLNLSFKRGTGVYKGVQEVSFVVIVNNETDIQVLRDFAFKSFGQESILHVDSNQEAVLIFNDGTREQLGRLEQVNREIATSRDAYTILDDKYFVTNKRNAAN
jgi:hypothetical protein